MNGKGNVLFDLGNGYTGLFFWWGGGVQEELMSETQSEMLPKQSEAL